MSAQSSAHSSRFHVDQPTDALLVFTVVSVAGSVLSAGVAEAGWEVGLLLLELRPAEFLWDASTFSAVVVLSPGFEPGFETKAAHTSM